MYNNNNNNYHPPLPTVTTLPWWGWLAGLNYLTCLPAGTLFPVGPPKPDSPQDSGQTKTDKLVLQEWGFCGWVANPPKESKVLKSKDAQPRTPTD